MLTQWHVIDPSHSAKSAGGRLHLNMHTFLPQRSRSGLTMLLSRHSVGTYRETSSRNSSGNVRPKLPQLTEPLWTDPGLKSGISVHKPISTSKNKTKQIKTKTKCRWGIDSLKLSQNSHKQGRSYHYHGRKHHC